MPKDTWIYLIKDNHTGFYKIGNSLNPYKRLSELKRQPTIMPIEFDLELIEAWYSDQYDEVELHKKFKSERVRGEWFKLSQLHIFQLNNYFYYKTKLSTRTSQFIDDQANAIEHLPADWVDVTVEGFGVGIL